MRREPSDLKKRGRVPPNVVVLDYLLWKEPLHTLVLVLVVNFTFVLTVIFKMSFTSIICDFLFVYIFLGICVNYLSDTLGYPSPNSSAKRVQLLQNPPRKTTTSMLPKRQYKAWSFWGTASIRRLWDSSRTSCTLAT